MLSIDTETTGVDFYHGAKPFFVTVCAADGTQQYWEWEVDPLTREPQIPPEDLAEVLAMVRGAARLVGQNIKFDVAALATLVPGLITDWPWERTDDTLLAGHLLASNRPHNLTDLALQYLGIDIEPKEKVLEKAVQECRRKVQQAKLRAKRGTAEADPLSSWRIAAEGLEEMPSAGAKTWKFDTWLPRALVRYLWETSEAGRLWRGPWDPTGQVNPALAPGRILDTITEAAGWEYRPPDLNSGDHPWWTVLADYANTDSAATLPLWQVMEAEVRRRGLGAIYAERRKVLRIAAKMGADGVTVSKARLEELRRDFTEGSARAGARCVHLAASLGYDLELPKSGNNGSLLRFCFQETAGEYAEREAAKQLVKAGTANDLFEGVAYIRNKGKWNHTNGTATWEPIPSQSIPPCLDLPVLARTETGAPSFNKEAVRAYLEQLPPNSRQLAFVKALSDKRKRDTSLNYMAGYQRFWLPVQGWEDWFRLHPQLNPTGTDTLRWSCSNPNEQNISKQEGFNLRYGFGPLPDEEWYSLDAKNIELRLPFYECGEAELIDLFERETEPPFYGSVHLLNFSVVYPEIWARELREVGLEKVGPHCKKKYAATVYQSCKNGGFSKQYGGQRRKVDATFRREGASDLLDARFSKLATLNRSWINFAKKHGYVETIPDRTVDPKRGYPVMVSRKDDGGVLETVPLNYHVQSSAMWWTMKAMIRVQECFDEWNRRDETLRVRLVMQVHDELVVCFARRGDPVAESKLRGGKGPLFRTRASSNLWRAREVQRLMTLGGDDFGIPTPVGLEYHPEHWAEGVTL